ncbi:B-cell receptor CD22-like [Alosa sapidissima]|uniref:B-cell receptor CD22-like n=1 Tax=Alosa sapidissima TaxID=34773 RepID=UPI001C081A68|nr:B-cell receptor CD22-like [Alosa sapidissima]
MFSVGEEGGGLSLASVFCSHHTLPSQSISNRTTHSMELSTLGLLLLLILCSYSGHAAGEETPKAVLVLDPVQTQFYTGESVTLRCDIEGQDTSGWRFIWCKDGQIYYPQEAWRVWNEYTVQPLHVSHSGDYTCSGVKNNTHSRVSEGVKLQVLDLPTAAVTVVSPQPPFYPGDTVTLRCDIAEHTHWGQYDWYKDSDQISSQNRKTITISLPDDAGHYTCKGHGGIRPRNSQSSTSFSISVTDLPTAAVTVVSPQPPFYPGDTVTLSCDIAEHTDWYQYYWYRGSDCIHQWNKQSTTIYLPDRAGQYHYTCEGTRGKRPKTSQSSTPVSVSVRACPEPELTVQTSHVFTGETVTLTCAIQPTRHWTYVWYKHGLYLFKTSETNTYTISRATMSDQGEYMCYGLRESSGTYSPQSNTVQITVEELPLATVTVEPKSPVFTGEMVTLKCVMESLSGWTYKWYKGPSRTPVSEGNTFTIRGAAESHKGQYWCQGERRDRPTASQPSRKITLDVKASKPKVTLSPDHQLLTGDSVTLRCELLGVSSGLVFYWYRDTQTSDPVAQTDGNSYSISSVKVSDGGQYWCRAGRGDPVFYTQYSDAVEIKCIG